MLNFSDILRDLKPYIHFSQMITLYELLDLLQKETDLNHQSLHAEKCRNLLLKFESDHHLNRMSDKRLMHILFDVLDRINKAFPVNDDDPISLEPIKNLKKNEVIILSSGHQFHIHSLIKYFNSKAQAVFTFENPSTRQAIAFRDCLKIIELAQAHRLEIVNQEYPPMAISWSLKIINAISTQYDFNAIQFRALVEVLLEIYRGYQTLKSKLFSLIEFYGLAFFYQCLFDRLNQESSSKPYNWQAQSEFLIINGLPSFLLLLLMGIVKNTRPLSEKQSIQSLYFLKIIGFHLMIEGIFQHISRSQDEELFCIRYLSLWMIIAQLSFPSSPHNIQTFKNHLVSGVISLCIEIYRHPQFSAQDFNRHYSSPLQIQLMFGLAKTVIYLANAFSAYQYAKNSEGRFFQNLQELRPLIQTNYPDSMV